jgi:hypothetical protein
MSPPRSHLLMAKRRRRRGTAPQREIPPRRNLRRHQLRGRQFVRLMKHNPGPEKRALRETRLFGKALRPGSNLACLMNPVRFTSLEAWWLVDGAWRPISPDEVLLNAAVMREARFNQFFPKVPRLPRNAFKADKFQN